MKSKEGKKCSACDGTGEDPCFGLRCLACDGTGIGSAQQFKDGPQWIKTSERLPEKKGEYLIRMQHKNDLPEDAISKDVANYFPKSGWQDMEGGWTVIEWLDEDGQRTPDAVEEQAEWEFLQIIKANFEIAKRCDGSEWKGYSAKKAVLETYEDIFEIIKGLPLKRSTPAPDAVELGKILELFKKFMPNDVAIDDPKQMAMYEAYHKLNKLFKGE